MKQDCNELFPYDIEILNSHATMLRFTQTGEKSKLYRLPNE
jgi:hypothetical protein